MCLGELDSILFLFASRGKKRGEAKNSVSPKSPGDCLGE